MSKELLEKIKKELEESASDYALDFVAGYSVENIHYLSDCITEFADNGVSVYYSDQFAYYKDHATDCEDALLELMDPNSIAQMIKKEGLYNLCCYAGVCGQYNEITNVLYQDEEIIKKLLIIRYLLKNDIFTHTEEEITEILEDAEDNTIDKGEELIEIIVDCSRSEEQ